MCRSDRPSGGLRYAIQPTPRTRASQNVINDKTETARKPGGWVQAWVASSNTKLDYVPRKATTEAVTSL